jgi:signal transduction histidine kinase
METAGNRRWQGIGRIAALSLSFLALAVAIVMFADTGQAERIAVDSGVLTAAERSLTSADLIRANTGIGIVLASAERAGIETADRWPAAFDQASRAHEQLVEQLPGVGDPRLISQSEAVGRHLIQVSSLIALGDIDGANEAALSGLVPSLNAITTSLLAIRDDVGSRIEAEQSTAGGLAKATSVTVAVLGPLLAVLAYQSVSRRKQVKHDLEEKLASEKQLVEAKDEIIANLSHELRTPLTSIYGFATLLVEDLSESSDDSFSEAIRSNAQMILSESADLSRMVDDLLTVIRADELGVTIRPEEVSARDEVEKVLKPFVLSGLTVRQSIEDAEILVDGLRYRQIVRNLIANANRHGGPHIAVIARVQGDHYELAVADDGPGVPESIKNRMFERFVHRGSEPLVAGSLGLGLSISRTLAEVMGGSLRYERIRGLTRFVISLPLSSAYAQRQSRMIAAR